MVGDSTPLGAGGGIVCLFFFLVFCFFSSNGFFKTPEFPARLGREDPKARIARRLYITREIQLTGLFAENKLFRLNTNGSHN